MIAGKKLTLAPILRAGVGFLDGMLALVPSARVAHIGLYRDPGTLQAVEYFFKAPHDLAERMVILMDPMLATGNSACAAASPAQVQGRARHPLRLPAGRSRRHRPLSGGASRRPDLDRRHRREAERSRLHRARPRRRRRPDVRHEVADIGEATARQRSIQSEAINDMMASRMMAAPYRYAAVESPISGTDNPAATAGRLKAR